jgi:hypothetical protein
MPAHIQSHVAAQAPITLPAVRWLKRPELQVAEPAAHLTELRVVRAGVEAWTRLRRNAGFADWVSVARALAVGRATAMRVAQTDRPVGSKYNAAVGVWLRQHGLDGIGAQERYKALLVVDHLDEVRKWRDALDEDRRRKLNHPSAVWAHWRRSVTKTDNPEPKVNVAPGLLHRLDVAVRHLDPAQAELRIDEARRVAEWLAQFLHARAAE